MGVLTARKCHFCGQPLAEPAGTFTFEYADSYSRIEGDLCPLHAAISRQYWLGKAIPASEVFFRRDEE